MPLSWPTKDPDEVLDYRLDWSARLATDTISTSLWIMPDGINQNSTDQTDTTTTLWLSGGTDGDTYVFTNRIATTEGRIMDQSVRLRLRSK